MAYFRESNSNLKYKYIDFVVNSNSNGIRSLSFESQVNKEYLIIVNFINCTTDSVVSGNNVLNYDGATLLEEITNTDTNKKVLQNSIYVGYFHFSLHICRIKATSTKVNLSCLCPKGGFAECTVLEK